MTAPQLPLGDPNVDFASMTHEEATEYVLTHDMSAWMAVHPDRGRLVTGPEDDELPPGNLRPHTQA